MHYSALQYLGKSFMYPVWNQGTIRKVASPQKVTIWATFKDVFRQEFGESGIKAFMRNRPRYIQFDVLSQMWKRIEE